MTLPVGFDPDDILNSGGRRVDPDSLPLPKEAEQARVAITQYDLTEIGNAERLVDEYGDEIKYSDALDWLAWDGTRFAPDNGKPQECAKMVAKSLYREAEDLTADAARYMMRARNLPDETDRLDAERKAAALKARAREAAQHAKSSNRNSSIQGVLKLASSDPSIRFLPGQLDIDPWLFNVQNGTIDLRTGVLREHRRADMLTKIAPVTFAPEASAPLWAGFVDWLSAGRPELGSFIQRAVGYTLTGSIREHALFVCQGPGGNGKSVFLETLMLMMGDYAVAMRPEALMTDPSGQDKAGEDVAKLPGARLAAVNETREGQRFNEARIKQLTGGDTVTARRLYKDPFDFRVAAKLWCRTNPLPKFEADEAMRRRLMRIPFDQVVRDEDKDPALPEKLRSELPGILAWAVQGCLDWQKEGLNPPPIVLAATAQYIAEVDPVSHFLGDFQLPGDGEVPSGRLYSDFRMWSVANDQTPMDEARFGKRLTALGWTKHRVRRHGEQIWVNRPPTTWKQASLLDAPGAPGVLGSPGKVVHMGDANFKDEKLSREPRSNLEHLEQGTHHLGDLGAGTMHRLLPAAGGETWETEV